MRDDRFRETDTVVADAIIPVPGCIGPMTPATSLYYTVATSKRAGVDVELS